MEGSSEPERASPTSGARSNAKGCEDTETTAPGRHTVAATSLPAAIGSDSTIAVGSAAGEPLPPPVDDPLIGQTLDRYRVLSRLGSGAMGVVYAALDPALDRKIALKILPRLDERQREHFETRLQREAQALARLDHPNVVTVYDVGVGEHSVFLAMQLVDGTTLDRHLEEQRLSPAAILDVFIEAARGLAAAHAANIVHRDFKPSNVLVAGTGRVCVGDFGLARGEDESESGPRDHGRTTLLSDRLTRAGAVLGTPLYMAPEQHRGEPATARSDQFSFCVALWEALFGVHPFVAEGSTRAAIGVAMARDEIRPAPRARLRAVPRRVVHALRQGLRHEPASRWRSMEELIDELVPRPRLRWLLAGLTVGGVAGGLALAAMLGGGPEPDPCLHAADGLADVWGPAKREAIVQAFAATKNPIAADTATRATGVISSYASAWGAARVEACRATRKRGTQSDDLLDRRMRCLDGRLAEVDGLVATFSAANSGVVDRAVFAASALPALDACADTAALLARKPPPADLALRARVDELDKAAARAHAAIEAGSHVEVGKQIGALEAGARATAWTPVIAQVLYVAGMLEVKLGHHEQAAAKLREAARVAASAGDPLLAGRALSASAFSMVEAGRPADALLVVDDAEILAARPEDAKLIMPDLHSTRGGALRAMSKLREARAEYEKGVAAERAGANDRLEVARHLNSLANALDDLGEMQRAEAMYREILETLQHKLGPEHPQTVKVLSNLGNNVLGQGRPTEAVPLLERALSLKRKTLPAGHPSIAVTLHVLGASYKSLARFADAERLLRESIEIRTKALGPDHSQTLSAKYQLAGVFRVSGRLEEAIALHREVLERKIAVLGPEHKNVTNSIDALGRAFSGRARERLNAGKTAQSRADIETAIGYFERARTLREKLYGKDSLDVAGTSVALAEMHEARGDCAQALREAERGAAYYRAQQITTDPDRGGALIAIAMCQRKLGQPAAARKALAELTSIADRSETLDPERLAIAYQMYAELQWADGDRAAGVEAATKAVEVAKRGKLDALRAASDRWLASHRIR